MQFNDFKAETHPDPTDMTTLQDNLDDFNLRKTCIPFDGEVAIFLRDDRGQMTAGIWGWVWGRCMEIRYLWVSESLRGQGLGSRLLHAAEQEGRTRGAQQVVLDTHEFQAPGFYLKLGYEVVGVVDNYPQGYKKYYFRKGL